MEEGLKRWPLHQNQQMQMRAAETADLVQNDDDMEVVAEGLICKFGIFWTDCCFHQFHHTLEEGPFRRMEIFPVSTI